MNPTETQVAESAMRRLSLSESEIADLLELARNTNARDWAIFCTAFHHGLRVSEVIGLTLADSINWKDRTITVNRLKGSLKTTQSIVEMRGKPAMNEMLALKTYLKERIDDGSGRLFTGQKGPLQRWALTRMFRNYCQQVSAERVARGLQPIPGTAMHFHCLKHSLCSILASRVDNIFLVKTQVGHAAISSTMRYCTPDSRLASAKSKEVLMQVFASV